MQIGVSAMVNMLSQANQWVGLLINQYTSISARIGKSYKKLNKYLTVFIERVIFWNAKGYGWSIGSTAFLVSGTHSHKSGLDSDELWNGKWEKNVTVDCREGVIKALEITTKAKDLFQRADEDDVLGTAVIKYANTYIYLQWVIYSYNAVYQWHFPQVQ